MDPFVTLVFHIFLINQFVFGCHCFVHKIIHFVVDYQWLHVGSFEITDRFIHSHYFQWIIPLELQFCCSLYHSCYNSSLHCRTPVFLSLSLNFTHIQVLLLAPPHSLDRWWLCRLSQSQDTTTPFTWSPRSTPQLTLDCCLKTLGTLPELRDGPPLFHTLLYCSRS
jgi:hypothetical protein